ncbi:hypothetical protein TNCV_2053281 [Trichonephila clavipes]|nr:hypothetical protein TNCV_2053281 [Trichonephila clavipes]
MTSKPQPKIVRMQTRKMESLILKENFLTHRFIASKLEMSSGTVSKMIHKDLKLKKMLKLKVHLLLPIQIAERKTNYRKLYEKHVAAEKTKCVVKLDETWNILEPIFEAEIPALYGKVIDKFELLMDKDSNHTFKSPVAYLAKKESETGIKL